MPLTYYARWGFKSKSGKLFSLKWVKCVKSKSIAKRGMGQKYLKGWKHQNLSLSAYIQPFVSFYSNTHIIIVIMLFHIQT